MPVASSVTKQTPLPTPKAIDLLASIADYLARERTSDVRHEFYLGEITEMPGGTFEHGLIATYFAAALVYLLRGTDCRVVNSDVKIFIEPGIFYYPDACVVQGRPQIDFKEAIRNPIVVIEVLSESTEAKDRDQKMRHYQRIYSLQHYILVEQNAPRIEQYEKDATTGAWKTAPVVVEGLDANLYLSALNISVPLADIYQFATFDAEI